MSDELERAADRLARDPRVFAVYGFGSRARGVPGPESDVDVAVLLEHPLSLGDELRLRAEVVEELRRDDVDLVVLNQAPPLLRWEVVSAGRRLFARDDEAADRFERRAAMECFDTAYLRATQQRLAREARA
jgi:predicted nucleotidyltransferase